jgi:hypothetical protein
MRHMFDYYLTTMKLAVQSQFNTGQRSIFT